MHKVRMMALIMGLPCLALVVYVAVSSSRNKEKALLLLDNSTSGPVKVAIDGKQVVSLVLGTDYGSHERVSVEPGKHRITATDAKGVEVESADVEIPPKENGRGFRGIFCVGRGRRYVLATLVYQADPAKDIGEESTVLELPPAAPLAVLPRDLEDFEISRIDAPFLDTMTFPSGADFVKERHICTLSTGTGGEPRLGCQGFSGDDR